MKGTKEKWKSLKSSHLTGLYKISSHGRILSLHDYNKRKPAILNPYFNRARNYFYVSLQCRGYRKNFRLSRLVAEHFVENINPKEFQEVHHKDFNTKNDRAENLVWCSRSYNLKEDYRGKNRARMRGELSGMSRLKTSEVLEIHAMFKKGIKQQVIATTFKINACTVSLVVHRKRWAHIESEKCSNLEHRRK